MARRVKAAADAKPKETSKAKPPAKPRKSRSTVPTEETLAALSRERLTALILEEIEQSPAFKKRVSASLAALQGPDSVAGLIDRRLAALEKARGFIDWQKRKAFAADLDATVTTILSDLKPLDEGMALDRLLRFITGAEAVLERVEDSGGQVHAIYERSAEAAAGLAGGLPAAAAERFARQLLDRLDKDGFGLIGSLLEDLVPKLPKASLGPLDATLVQALAALPAKPKPTKKPGPLSALLGNEGDWELSYRRRRLSGLRQAIADARGDVDAFIAIETQTSPERPNLAAVAERLLAAGRAEEALDWIRRKEKPGLVVVTREDLISGAFEAGGPAREREAIEIAILDALGRGEEAQALRWSRFERNLDEHALRDYLARLPDFEDEEALERAFAHAAGHKEAHSGLYFLMRWPDHDRAARLVLDRHKEWSGRVWELLAPAAEALAPDHPLAASLLYRVLIDDILERARSAAYGHGARDLLKLGELARELEPGSLTPDHEAYAAALRKKHGRKYGFWTLVDGKA